MPKGTVSLEAELRRQLKARPEELQEVVRNLIEQALDKDDKSLRAIAMMFDRTDGAVERSRSEDAPDQEIPEKSYIDRGGVQVNGNGKSDG